jgi:hypothetical protein
MTDLRFLALRTPRDVHRREDTERFIEEVRGDDADACELSADRERELEDGRAAASTLAD